MPKVGELLTLDIHGVSSQMEGVGRPPEGYAVFVPGALPGERVQARVVEDGGRFARAALEKALVSSPRRARPFCPIYGQCGGCAAQHMEYAHSLELKGQIVAQAMERIGGFSGVEVRPALGMQTPFRYRNKAEYACRGEVVGGMRGGSHQVIAFEDCMLQHEDSIALMRGVQGLTKGILRGVPLSHFVTRVNHKGQSVAVLSTSSFAKIPSKAVFSALRESCPGLVGLAECRLARRPAHALDGKIAVLEGEGVLYDQVMGHAFALSPQSFFQVNREQAEKLYRLAVEWAAPAGTGLAVDIYSGVGGMTLPLARRAERAIGIEMGFGAVQNARENARRAGIDNVRFLAGDAAEVILNVAAQEGRADGVVLDPPRKGCDGRVLDAVLRMAPKRIAYVSCNPATLARDLKALCACGAYRIERVQPVDMFGWTEHVEACAQLCRR